jgi:excisionase family DNA binding protein
VERLLTRQEVADRLGVPVKTVATWAYTGVGPRYIRVGKHARYRSADVEAWCRKNEVGRLVR